VIETEAARYTSAAIMSRDQEPLVTVMPHDIPPVLGQFLRPERADQISLPPVSYVRHNPLANRARPEPVPIDIISMIKSR
jgi:hypothetical protein